MITYKELNIKAKELEKKTGLPEPEFLYLRGDFKVVFRKEKINRSEQKSTEETQSGQKWTEKK